MRAMHDIKPYLQGEAKAWLRFKNGGHEVVRIVPTHGPAAQCYCIYPAYESLDEVLGYIYFDQSGYWIYDGDLLHPDEQEQLAQFITTYVERL